MPDYVTLHCIKQAGNKASEGGSYVLALPMHRGCCLLHSHQAALLTLGSSSFICRARSGEEWGRNLVCLSSPRSSSSSDGAECLQQPLLLDLIRQESKGEMFHSQLLSRDPGQPTGTFLPTGSPPQHTHSLLSSQYTFPYLQKQQKQRQQ